MPLKTFTFLFLLTLTASCNSFENKFYKKIQEGEINSIKSKKSVMFDLSSLTDFDWDSVLIIHGNESVPVNAEQIEVDLKRTTTDLPTLTDRFYFLQKDKKVIVKEIESMIFHDPDVNIEFCLIDTTNYRPWLSRDECKFRLMSNSKRVSHGGIFLFPPCRTWVTEKSLKVFE
ncbi:hypothetical protein AHMF7605_27015 [Adhaeribacter arboris]|uniref:Lipoprotein n=1 Tax=Adhaeribacter arboris TaxID=2072846 RepID=A0A2T2YN11_9BACT|nr:hypothetical protein [Adhaeribacter arboris]PSR56888.1 hypothetical protein AHMF7605_27015 [Adhaeribacter arboris]